MEVSGQLETLPFYPCKKSPRYPLERRLGEAQSRSGRYGKVKIISTYRDWNADPSVVQPTGSRYTDYATAAHNVYGV
jgi:hypothetical protein